MPDPFLNQEFTQDALSWFRPLSGPVRGRRVTLGSNSTPGRGANRTRFSIGAKLALRYTAVLSVTLTVVALFVYAQVTQRVNRDARLLLEIQVADLADALESQRAEHDPDHVRAWFGGYARRVVENSDPSLGLGVELRDASGERLAAAGSLAAADVPIPLAVLESREESVLRAVNIGEQLAYLSVARRVPDGILQVAMNTRRYADNIEHIRDVFLLSLPLVLVLSALAGWLLARGSLRPIARITRTARAIGAANLDESVERTGSGDELDQLAETLNEMLARIRDSVGRMRRFNANAAHELRTPLNALSSEVEVTLEQPREAHEYRQVLVDVMGRVRSLATSVDAMLRLARSEAGLDPQHTGPVQLEKVLETVYDFFAPLAEDQGVSLRLFSVPRVIVQGDASWLHQLFSNLVSNALKFTPEGGSVEMSGVVESGRVRVHVRDTGRGVPEAQLDRIFDRYERGTRDSSPGFGLGLPIAREIARAHGGGISVESAPGQGTTFTVELPLEAGP